MIHTVSCNLGGKELKIETGKMARQANGAVLVSYGDTRVLVTACGSDKPKEGINFFPLTVEYAERFYAAGRIPGSFFRREGRPTTEATLSARMIDRPIRPLFPEGFRNEVQVVATVLSMDPTADVDSAASIGAAAALHISDIPFNGPTAGVRVGRVNGEYVINPSWEVQQTEENELEIFITGTKNAIMMVEGGAREVPEDIALGAILTGHAEIKKITQIIEELRQKCGKEKMAYTTATVEASVTAAVEKAVGSAVAKALKIKEKQDRYTALDAAEAAAIESLVPASLKESNPEEAKKKEKDVKEAFELCKYNKMRSMILDDKMRIDGRNMTTVRQINTEAGLLPRAHGSSLFTRGETQVLAAVTLGTGEDEQIVDSLYEKSYRKYMLHYNFPPYSVGETGRMGGQSRREIGHGMLAERAIRAMIPKHEDFPYTIRIVCETLESNGSSSMGSVCSASMALMDSGVPLPRPVAGIAMGLIKEGSKVAVLTDILGDEDHLGDMDFKVAGTDKGITAIQMDIKIEGVNEEIMRTALAQAREGRLHILEKMAETITQPRSEINRLAPRITSIMVPIAKIAEVIGPSGKMIKSIIAETGAKIDINDDGRVNIASANAESVQKAVDMIKGIVEEVEIGRTYKGTVKKIVDFGAFVNVLPGQDGLLHVSEIAHERVNKVDDFFKVGDQVDVKVIAVDDSGKIRLSRKALLEGGPARSSGGENGGGGQGGHGGGGGGRGRDDRGGRDRGPRRDGPRGDRPFRN